MKMQELIETVQALTQKVESLEAKLDSMKTRDRGPNSTRSMSRMDAWRVLHGDLKSAKTKDAASALGLSYGQVYSARGTYTFKDVKASEFTQEAVNVA